MKRRKRGGGGGGRRKKPDVPQDGEGDAGAKDGDSAADKDDTGRPLLMMFSLLSKPYRKPEMLASLTACILLKSLRAYACCKATCPYLSYPAVITAPHLAHPR